MEDERRRRERWGRRTATEVRALGEAKGDFDTGTGAVLVRWLGVSLTVAAGHWGRREVKRGEPPN